MLQSWAVGFRRNCTLLLDTARGFPVRVGWIGFSGALYGLFAGAVVSHLLDSCIIRLDAGWKDF